MELRQNPILSQWIIVSSKRGKQPQLPKGSCPFCPRPKEVPETGWTVLHQKLTDGKDYTHHHFHVEFYPTYREKDKIKYFASFETGTGTVTFDYTPEMKAKELRESPETKG